MKTLDEISRKVSILFLIETKMLAAKTFFRFERLFVGFQILYF